VVHKEVALAVFNKYYSTLCDLLSAILHNLMPKLITKEIINYDEKRDIDSKSSDIQKAKTFLCYIEASLKVCTDCFSLFLDVLKEYDSLPVRVLLNDIKKDLEYRSSVQGMYIWVHVYHIATCMNMIVFQ